MHGYLARKQNAEQSEDEGKETIKARQRTGMCARMSLQVEGVVEAFAAEGAEVALDV